MSRKRGSRERKEGRHRGWEEDGREWRIEIYRFIGNRLRHGRVGRPFMKLPLRNIPLWKRLTPNRSLLFSPPPPPTLRSANGTKREGARETSASYYWNYGRSDARKSKFPHFFCHRIPRIVYDLLPAKRRRFRSGAEETRGEGATQGRPLADLGKANKCEGNRRERGMIISHSSSPRLDLHCRSFRRSTRNLRTEERNAFVLV